MSDAPLFQNADEEEARYGSTQPAADDTVVDETIVAIPGAGLGGSGVGSPGVGAGTPGTFPPAIAPVPDEEQGAGRRTDASSESG